MSICMGRHLPCVVATGAIFHMRILSSTVLSIALTSTIAGFVLVACVGYQVLCTAGVSIPSMPSSSP